MLALSGVSAGYGSFQALFDVSLEVRAGESVAVLGPNGAGKTTLLRVISKLIPASAGEMTMEGARLNDVPAHEVIGRGIAHVPENRRLFPRLTVEENLRMGLATLPRGARVPERIFEMFPVLRQMLARRGGDLSGGQQQQLAIGRALAMGPKLLILDEPTEGIQPSIIKDIERAIRALAATGDMAILLVEQYYDFARSLADQYLVMDRGVLVKRGAGADMESDGVKQLLAV
jgi:urea transport system ATP-binding protein